MTTKKSLFRPYIPVIFLSLLLNSCAVSNITTVNKTEIQRPYSRIAIIYTNANRQFYRLDSTTYNNFLKRRFNALSSIDFTRQLNNTFQKTLESNGTTVAKSTDAFEVNTEVPYPQFLKAIQRTGAQALLIVNLRHYWHAQRTTDSADYASVTVNSDTEPNADFLCYLVDLKSMEPVWMAKSTVNGINAGYGTLNDYLASKVYNKLVEAHYIYRKSPNPAEQSALYKYRR